MTVDASGAVHRPGALDVVDGEVAWVGPPAAAPPPPGRVHDVGGLLMPGLVNTHAHTPMTLVRGAGDGLPLDRWLQEAVWPLEARFTEDDVRWGMLLGCAEMLGYGVTTTCEMYLHGRTVAESALEAGIRCVLTPGIFELPGGLTWQRTLDDAGQVYADCHGRTGRLTVGFGPHSAYMVPDEGLEATARAAGEVGALVQIHVAETGAEDPAIPERLARLGFLDVPVLAAHSVWLTDTDLDLFRRHDAAVAHCPQSNGKLGSGVARLADMLALGLRVGLGTDGPASNDNLDLWEEMRLAPLVARASGTDASLVPTAEALRLATRGGAQALGLDTGSLEPGLAADFVRLDLSDPSFVPALDERELLAHLVWAAPSRLVTDVWVGGRQVVAAGRCTTVDVDEARRQVAARARRIREGAGTASP